MSAPPDSVIQAAPARQGVVKKNAMSAQAVRYLEAATGNRVFMITFTKSFLFEPAA